MRKHKEIYSDTVKFLNENLYVDDLIGSHPSMENVLATSLESVNILQDASMELPEWNTNSKRLHQHWVENGFISNNTKPFEENNIPNKVLGLGWNNSNDTLHFDTRDIINFTAKIVDMEWFVLQSLSRIIDPLHNKNFDFEIMIIMWEGSHEWLLGRFFLKSIYTQILYTYYMYKIFIQSSYNFAVFWNREQKYTHNTCCRHSYQQNT